MATSAAKQAAPPAHEPPPIGTHDARPVKRTRKVRHICSLGTGEVVHILYYKALADKVDDFELVVQGPRTEPSSPAPPDPPRLSPAHPPPCLASSRLLLPGVGSAWAGVPHRLRGARERYTVFAPGVRVESEWCSDARFVPRRAF